MTLCEQCSSPLPGTEGVVMQELVLEDWHPANFQSGGHGGTAGMWRSIKERNDARTRVRAAATAAGWVPVIGKALIDVTYVYQANYRADLDNLTHRLKGLLDGLKTIPRGTKAQSGWITDDNTELLDLRVRKVVERGRKALIVRLYGQTGTACSTSNDSSAGSEPLVAPTMPDIDSIWTQPRRSARSMTSVHGRSLVRLSAGSTTSRCHRCTRIPRSFSSQSCQVPTTNPTMARRTEARRDGED